MNNPLPKVTAFQVSLTFDDVRAVQVIPLGEVMIRSTVPLPEPETATNNALPKIIERQLLLGDVRAVQVVPLGEVMTKLLPKDLPTATNNPFPKVIELQ